MEISKYFGSKKIGYLSFDPTSPVDKKFLPGKTTKDYYVILYITKGSRITVDFIEHDILQDSLFFFNMGQHFHIDPTSSGSLIYFNPDFYCIAFHDKELTCDGILFNNVYMAPSIAMHHHEAAAFSGLIEEIKIELGKEDFWTEEMARTKLKQLVIMSSRCWMRKYPDQTGLGTADTDLGRKFSQLVERYYNKFHSVAEYADLLHVSPKTLNRKIVSEKKTSPNVLIKNRIILQAKRLLAYTELTTKEVASQLGYIDQSYFVRFFKIQTGDSPLTFRKKMAAGVSSEMCPIL